MKIEEQIVSLAVAKRLKELGVKQQPWFFWVNLRDKNAETKWEVAYAGDKRLAKVDMYEWYPAYTVGELGELLPWEYTTLKNLAGKYVGVQTRVGTSPLLLLEGRKNEAETRGLLLAHLLEYSLKST